MNETLIVDNLLLNPSFENGTFTSWVNIATPTNTASTAMNMLAQSMSENDLLESVVSLAKLHGWLIYHARPGMMRSGKWATPTQGHVGWPDLTLCRRARLMFVELKSQQGKPTTGQEEWLVALGKCAVEVYIWKPSDWLEGTILGILKGN